jgi:hypothetical protein
MQYLPNYKYKKNAFLLCMVGFIMCWPRHCPKPVDRYYNYCKYGGKRHSIVIKYPNTTYIFPKWPISSCSQNGTDSTDSGISKSERLIIGVFLTIMTVLTIFGNILVLYAIKREKELQTKFNIYIANLAITDLTVAITAMTFYTTDSILGYWPFGKYVCGI